MAKKIGEETQVTLDLKTIGMIITFVIMFIIAGFTNGYGLRDSEAFTVIFGVTIFVGLITALVVASKIFEKAGQDKWLILIPIYNLIIL